MATMKQCDKCGKTVPYEEAYLIKTYDYTATGGVFHIEDCDLCESCYEALMEQ